MVTMLEWHWNNFTGFDVGEVLQAHWFYVIQFSTIVTVGGFYPFKKGEGVSTSFDNIGRIFVACGRLVEID